MVLRTCGFFRLFYEADRRPRLAALPENRPRRNHGAPVCVLLKQCIVPPPARHGPGTIEGMKHLLLVAAVAAFGASGASATRGLSPPCEGADLTGSFRVVPGSAGAGN